MWTLSFGVEVTDPTLGIESETENILGGIDGRTARGIASRILKASGERYLRMEQSLAERDKTIAEKEATIASQRASMDEKDRRIAELEKELGRYKEYFGKTARPQATSANSSLPPSKDPLSVPRTAASASQRAGNPVGRPGMRGIHTCSPTAQMQ